MRVLERSKCAVLSLVLKRKWFKMIERGEKREEYRMATEYWGRRIWNWVGRAGPPGCGIHLVLEFRLGYAGNAKRIAFLAGMGGVIFEARPMPASPPRLDWGEPITETQYYALHIGERVELVGDVEGAGRNRRGKTHREGSEVTV